MTTQAWYERLALIVLRIMVRPPASRVRTRMGGSLSLSGPIVMLSGHASYLTITPVSAKIPWHVLHAGGHRARAALGCWRPTAWLGISDSNWRIRPRAT
jgi:hypothetical protein